MRFYIVRHGKTLFNTKGIVQGACDSPLTQVGIEQAKEVAQEMKDIAFEAAYSSTQERAMDTCQILMNGREIPFTPLKAFKEQNFGIYEGEKQDDVFKSVSSFDELDELIIQNGGEKPEDVAKRFVDQMMELTKIHTSNVLIAAHGMCIVYAMKAIDQEKFESLLNGLPGLGNCATCIVDHIDGKLELVDIINRNTDF